QQPAGRGEDRLQHLTHRQVRGDREDRGAHRTQLIPVAVAHPCTVPTARVPGDRALDLGPRTEDRAGRSPMAAGPSVPSVGCMDNSEKTAIVTGASRGLGLALAAGLAGAGWRLVVDARDGDALAEAVWALPGTHTVLAGDVTDPAHRAALVDAAQRTGRLDLLVNNAGILGPSPQPNLSAYPLDALREVYEVNVFAPLALAQAALPALRASGGALVNVTSDAAVEPYPGWGGYGSAKAAVE